MKITLKGNVRVKNLNPIQIKSPYTVDLSSVDIRKENKGYLTIKETDQFQYAHDDLNP